MGRLHIPAFNQIKGPWLLNHEKLESLNNLFSEIDDQLIKSLQKTIEGTAKQQGDEDIQTQDLSKRIAKLQRKFNSNVKLAIAVFADGSTFEANDIKEIIHHVSANSSQSLTAISLRVMRGNHENEFNLIIDSTTSEEGEEDFEYSIKCLDYDLQLEIKTAIDKWVRENKPSQSLQIWSSIVGLVAVVSGLAIVLSFSELSTTGSKAESYKTELKQQALKIIENNNVEFNNDSTLLLLLKLQSDYIPDKLRSETITVYNNTAKKILIASIIIFLISLVRPKTVIGIGKKHGLYKFYIFWWTYIIRAGFALLLTTFLKDIFLQFIK